MDYINTKRDSTDRSSRKPSEIISPLNLKKSPRRG